MPAAEQVDVVVPVPETSRVVAMHCAARLGLPFEEGLTKNRRAICRPPRGMRVQHATHDGRAPCGGRCTSALRTGALRAAAAGSRAFPLIGRRQHARRSDGQPEPWGTGGGMPRIERRRRRGVSQDSVPDLFGPELL